jgi:hypothetical protein
VTGVQNEPHVYEISYTLKNLTSSTDYEAVLLTRNHNGWSKESQVHQFHINGKSKRRTEYLYYFDGTLVNGLLLSLNLNIIFYLFTQGYQPLGSTGEKGQLSISTYCY